MLGCELADILCRGVELHAELASFQTLTNQGCHLGAWGLSYLVVQLRKAVCLARKGLPPAVPGDLHFVLVDDALEGEHLGSHILPAFATVGNRLVQVLRLLPQSARTGTQPRRGLQAVVPASDLRRSCRHARVEEQRLALLFPFLQPQLAVTPVVLGSRGPAILLGALQVRFVFLLRLLQRLETGETRLIGAKEVRGARVHLDTAGSLL